MTEQPHTDGWCCYDCLALLANGDTPPEMNEQETAEYLARIDERTGGHEITLGSLYGANGCTCDGPDDENHERCENCEFSWSHCDVCGSHLGGSRHAVTFWWPTIGQKPRCTGETYNVNPDAPEEGIDIRHENPCPAHPDAEIRQAERMIGTE